MTVTKKPIEPSSSAPPVDVDALIRKGGSVVQPPPPAADQVKLVQLRLSASLRDRIGASRKKRLVAPSRHMWLLEAIYEKLEREAP